MFLVLPGCGALVALQWALLVPLLAVAVLVLVLHWCCPYRLLILNGLCMACPRGGLGMVLQWGWDYRPST